MFKTEEKEKLIKELREIEGNSNYLIRWGKPLGDFTGRESTIEVFGIPIEEQKEFFRVTREIRRKFFNKHKASLTFVFRKYPTD